MTCAIPVQCCTSVVIKPTGRSERLYCSYLIYNDNFLKRFLIETFCSQLKEIFDSCPYLNFTGSVCRNCIFPLILSSVNFFTIVRVFAILAKQVLNELVWCMHVDTVNMFTGLFRGLRARCKCNRSIFCLIT